VQHTDGFEALLIGGRSSAGKTSAGWEASSLLQAARITAVLLTASDATIRDRLSAREIGTQLDAHLARSATMARHLETTAPPSVTRIPTDNRTITDIAHDIITATRWSAHPTWTSNHEVRLEY
jgi:hypothetical protein